MSVPEHDELWKLLEKVAKSEVRRLFEPEDVQISDFSNIVVRFFNIEDWLLNDGYLTVHVRHKVLRDVRKDPAAAIRDYKKAKTDYVKGVRDQFPKFTTNLAGRALLSELDRGGHRSVPRIVRIVPYDKEDKNAEANPVDKRGATCLFCKQRDADGVEFFDRPLGTGEGSDVLLPYTPSMWNGTDGPATHADEVLFHELVHATREMAGVVESLPVDKLYDNMEEYMAIVLTNIYLATKKKKHPLRANHSPTKTPLSDPEKFLDNVQQVNFPPRKLMDRLSMDQSSFYVDLAYNIPRSVAWWNPVRQFEEEEKAEILAKTTGDPVKVKPLKRAPAPSKGNRQGIIDE